MELPPLSLEEAEAIHAAVMEEYPEEPSGVLDRGLLESALLRPAHAAEYANADEYEQAATLLWGLVKAHAFVQGNKRTATAISFFFPGTRRIPDQRPGQRSARNRLRCGFGGSQRGDRGGVVPPTHNLS